MYRGRIIELLRKSSGALSSNRIGTAITDGFKPKDSAWLLKLLRSLERDGLVKLKNGASTVHVSLAE
jgi:hypothetical protein